VAVDRVFLDANILFSAAYKGASRLRLLWRISNAELITSEYAVEEARRNLLRARPESMTEFESLLDGLTVIGSPSVLPGLLPEELDGKDAPILAAAVRSEATHFLTGDKRHFGRFVGQTIRGVYITTAAHYLRERDTLE